MKKDNFISVGLILKPDTTTEKIEELHSMLYQKYNYFEIILLNYDLDIEHYNTLLKSLTNLRIIELSSYVDIEIAHTTLIENCIDLATLFRTQKYKIL